MIEHNVNGKRPTLDDLLRNESTSAGRKDDGGKPTLSLISRHAMEQEAKVLDFGARKYDAWNWSKGIKYSRVLSALMRHAFAYADGESQDPETGLSHMAHVRCCAGFLLDYELNHPEMNDLRRDENRPVNASMIQSGAIKTAYQGYKMSSDNQGDGIK